MIFKSFIILDLDYALAFLTSLALIGTELFLKAWIKGFDMR